MAVTKDDLLKKLRAEIPEVSPEDVRAELERKNGLLVVDVREGDEFRAGHLPGAVHLPRGFLELQAEKKLPDPDADLVAYCAGGVRSLLAGKILKEMGYGNVVSMTGGYNAWKNSGFKWVQDFQYTPEQLIR